MGLLFSLHDPVKKIFLTKSLICLSSSYVLTGQVELWNHFAAPLQVEVQVEVQPNPSTVNLKIKLSPSDSIYQTSIPWPSHIYNTYTDSLVLIYTSQ